MKFSSRSFWGTLALAASVSVAMPALAAEVVKVGFIAPMSGPFADFGKQMEAGIRVYQKQFGDSVAGKKVEIVVKDTGGPNPELAKRLAQELVVRDKVNLLAGFVFTPSAAAAAPIATEAKVPMVVMNAAGNKLTARSPYMVRTSFSFETMVPPMAEWALKQGHKRAYVVVADYAPGHDVQAAFTTAFKAGGGEIAGEVRTPMATVDFAPYVQRAKDAKPDVVFAFVNGGDVAPAFMREFRQKGLAQAGIELIGTGDITEEATIDAMGDVTLDTVTVYPYSMHHPGERNAAFVREYKAVRGASARPTIMSVAAYDGMAAIYAALKKTGGKADGDALMAAMKGLAIESPRGPIAIDAATRDVVQTQYIRRVKRVDGVLANVEFSSYGGTAR